jgi:hypothetical protein
MTTFNVILAIIFAFCLGLNLGFKQGEKLLEEYKRTMPNGGRNK